MKKLKQGTVCLIYKKTPTYKEGAVVQVIDRDPHDNSYAVATLQEVGNANGDIGYLLQNCVKWVKLDNLSVLEFNKPKYKYLKIIGYVLCLGLGLLIQDLF